jgi:hypothetical protein
LRHLAGLCGLGKIEVASIAGWEGSQSRNFGRLPPAQAADYLRHDVIKLISGGGGCNAGGPGEAAD